MKNFKILEIFVYSIFIIVLSIACQEKTNRDIFINKEVDLGSISMNDTIDMEIKIKNPYKNNLILKNSAGSCGCTDLIIRDSLLEQNETTSAIVKFIPSINGLKGDVKKAVVIETNSPQRFHEIIIKAKVE